MNLQDVLEVFNKCKERHNGCTKCPLSKVLIRTENTTYDICDCLIEIEKFN